MNGRNPKFEWQDAFAASGFTGNTGFIGLVMSLKDNGDGRNFFISYQRLSDITGLSVRTVQDHVGKLKEAGWVTVLHRGGNQGGTARATTYALTIPKQAVSAGQPEDSAVQPADVEPQPEASRHLVDQDSLDPSSIDPSSQSQSHWDAEDVADSTTELSELSAGAIVSGAWRSKLEPGEQRLFVPSFDPGDFWVFTPPAVEQRGEASAATGDVLVEGSSTSASRPPSRDHARRAQHIRVNRAEGLNENGEPLDDSSPTPERYRRR